MSNPKSKPKTASKPVEPKAKFSIGQKVFIIDSDRSFPGTILQGKIESVKTIQGLRGCYQEGASGTVKMEPHTNFEYELSTVSGWFYNVSEYRMYSTVTAASLDFTKPLTHFLR